MRKANKALGLSDHALEMVMWDVLNGMENFSLLTARKGSDFGLSLVQIEPSTAPTVEPAKTISNVIYPPQFQRPLA